MGRASKKQAPAADKGLQRGDRVRDGIGAKGVVMFAGGVLAQVLFDGATETVGRLVQDLERDNGKAAR